MFGRLLGWIYYQMFYWSAKAILWPIDKIGWAVWRMRSGFADYGHAATVGSFLAMSGIIGFLVASHPANNATIGLLVGMLVTAPGTYRQRPAAQLQAQSEEKSVQQRREAAEAAVVDDESDSDDDSPSWLSTTEKSDTSDTYSFSNSSDSSSSNSSDGRSTRSFGEDQGKERNKQPQNPDGQESPGQYLSEVPDIDFDDVAGMEEFKEILFEKIIDPLHNPEQYEEYGLSVENGFLLHGPPGTGKTYISKALAGEMGINYIEAKGADVISKWVGEGTENVAQLFREARQSEPCLVFIDEIDALVPERGGTNQHHDQQQMVNQFLEELSDLNEGDADVVVIGATNKPTEIDDAMMRSGRLSQKIKVPKPDKEGRIKILKKQLEAPMDPSWIDWDEIGEMTEGMTAADMEQVAKEAARNAMHRDDDVRQEDLKAGVEEVATHVSN